MAAVEAVLAVQLTDMLVALVQVLRVVVGSGTEVDIVVLTQFVLALRSWVSVVTGDIVPAEPDNSSSL